jgi:hypothetical protein
MDSPSTAPENQTPKEKPVVITAQSRKSFFRYSFVNPKFLGAMTVLLLMIGGVGTGVYLIQKPQQSISQASLSPVNLNFQPAEIQADSGSEFTVDVFTTAGDNKITGADLSIRFDPEILTLKSIAPKDFMPKILIPPKIASGSASISLGTDGFSGVSGNGVIASLLFTAKNANLPSSSQITFESTGTHIKILNRGPENENNILGTAEVRINPVPKAAAQTPFQSTPTGGTDFNGDGQINSIDLSLMYSAWGDPETETQKKADINGDGVVNGMDYSGMIPEYKQ